MLDRVFDLLSDERRRYALYYLEQQDGPVPIEEVAEQVTEWETDSTTNLIPDDKYEQVKRELHHKDVPKSAEAKFIEYDSDDEVVEVTGTPHAFHAIISVAKTIERPDRNP